MAQFGQTVLQTISNPDGTVSIIQVRLVRLALNFVRFSCTLVYGIFNLNDFIFLGCVCR